MRALLEKIVGGKRVLILGFGREGKSSYRLLRELFPEIRLLFADQDDGLNLSEFPEIQSDQLFLGASYLEAMKSADVVFKSPGIDFKGTSTANLRIVSQTSIFLEKFHRQIIGITGTKGKSTTSSLIFDLLKSSGKDAVLVGNIGVPPFDALHLIGNETRIVFEISAHQLEYVSASPHIAILLNIFQEHLDHFHTMANYAGAKLNIAHHQQSGDFLIYDKGNLFVENNRFQSEVIPVDLSEQFYKPEKQQLVYPGISLNISTEKCPLRGLHNLKNILAAAIACRLAGITSEEIENGLATFKPLEHRLEFAGISAGITFINDSISTIPEATIEAVRTLPETDTIILGGKDRGIDYSGLIDFLAQSQITNFLFTGPAGLRMMEMLKNQVESGKNIVFVDDWNELPALILRFTQKGKACLLSPAASSYDRFSNFEERGKVFKEIVNLIRLKSQP